MYFQRFQKCTICENDGLQKILTQLATIIWKIIFEKLKLFMQNASLQLRYMCRENVSEPFLQSFLSGTAPESLKDLGLKITFIVHFMLYWQLRMF